MQAFSISASRIPRSHRSSVGMHAMTLQRRLKRFSIVHHFFIRCDAGASRYAFPTKTLGTRKCDVIANSFQFIVSPFNRLTPRFPRSHRSSVGNEVAERSTSFRSFAAIMHTTTLQRRLKRFSIVHHFFIRCDAGASRYAFPTKTLGTRKP